MRWLLLLGLVGCAGVESVDTESQPVAAAPEPLHVVCSLPECQVAVDSWNAACGSVLALADDGVRVDLVSRGQMTSDGWDSSDVGGTKNGRIDVISYLTGDRLKHALAHELGHAMGHAHVTDRVSVMNAYEDQTRLVMPRAEDCE